MGLPSPRKSSNKSPARGTKTLNNYFSPSPSKKRAVAAINVELENLSNGSDRREPRAAIGVGTAESPLHIDDTGVKTVAALVRVKNSIETPRKLKYRAGDDGVFVLFKGGILGRDLTTKNEPTPRKAKTKKIHLGIVCGGSIGVSRKQVLITKMSPLTIKHFPMAINQIGVRRYNPVLKTMGTKVDYVAIGKETTLKPGDTIEMDRCSNWQDGEEKKSSQHVFRIVDCLVPQTMGNAKKRAFAEASTPKETIDLVEPKMMASPKKDLFPRASASSPQDAIDLVESQTMTSPKKRRFARASAAPSPSVTFDLVDSDDSKPKRAKSTESRKSMESVTTVCYPRNSEDSHNTELEMASQGTSSSSFSLAPKQKKKSAAKPSSSVAKLEAAAKKPAKKAPQFEVKARTSPKKSPKKLRSATVKSVARTVQSDDTVVETRRRTTRIIKKRIPVKEEMIDDTTMDVAAKPQSKKVEQEPTQNKRQPKENAEPVATKSKKTARKVKEEFKEDEWDLSKATVKQESKVDPATMAEMQQPLSSAYFRALNSSDPLVGLDLLIQTASFGKRGMNPNIGSSVRELLTRGPSSEGTRFPDAHRVETMLRYLDTLTKLEGGNDNFSMACGVDEWSALQDILEKILEPRYIFEGDESSKDADAMGRLISSIHLSASTASFLSMLLRAELGEQLQSATPPDKSPCRQGPLAQAMLDNSNGIRNSVKAMLKVYVRSWLRYGHYLLCDMPSAPAMRRRRNKTETMFKNLGSVVSQVLWFYSVCEGIQIDDPELAVLFKEVYDVETNTGMLDPAVCMSTKKVPAAYWKKLKLRLILSLDDKIVEPVQSNLAVQFKVAKEYNCVME